MKTLIRNGKIVDTVAGEVRDADILIENDVIKNIGKGLRGDPDCRIYDANGLYVCPGFVDMHVHLREPGFEAMETIESGTKAAVRGGFTTVACMPNTNPPIDNEGILTLVRLRAEKDGYAEVLPVACITKGRRGWSFQK